MNDQTVQSTYYEMLTSTAALMREQHGPEHERHAMWGAMADLLDAAAETTEPYFYSRAIAVARAYIVSVTEAEPTR